MKELLPICYFVIFQIEFVESDARKESVTSYLQGDLAHSMTTPIDIPHVSHLGDPLSHTLESTYNMKGHEPSSVGFP